MKIYCVLLFILTVIDTASLIMLLTSGELSMANITSNHSAAMAVSIMCIMQLKRPQGKSGPVTAAKIAIVVLAISFVYSVFRSFSGNVNWPAMLNPLVSIMILVGFIKDARQLALPG